MLLLKGNNICDWEAGQSGRDSWAAVCPPPGSPFSPLSPSVPFCPRSSGFPLAYSWWSHSVDLHFPAVSSGLQSGAQVPGGSGGGWKQGPCPPALLTMGLSFSVLAACWEQAGTSLPLIASISQYWGSVSRPPIFKEGLRVLEFQSRCSQRSCVAHLKMEVQTTTIQ